MLGITEKYNQFKKSTYFAGGKFVIYAARVYLAATFAAGCLGAVIGFPLLTFPLAMLISNPVVWVLMGVVLTAAYKMVVKPLFHLAKDYINKKKAPEGEKSEEKEVEPQKSPEKQEQTVANQERPKTPGRDSGIFECEKDKNSFLYRTENGDYKYHLSTTDIIDIAESKYRWIGYIDRKGLKDTSQGVYFTCPDNLESSLHGQLKKYKSQQEGKNLIFTSILNLNGNHWVTLVVAYNPNSVSRAYYCDSFGKDLPNEILDALQKTLKMGRNNIRISKEKQQEDDYNCGIFALENAHRITQMFNENKSSDEIKRELSEYKPNEEELKNKRIEFAKVLEKYKRSGVNMPDSQRKSRRSSVASGDSGLGSKKFHENLDTLVHQTNRGNCKMEM
ncbi:hypothetical protein HC358_00585 [Wolbachia pipientis]|uniref:Ubiquitin-like protease family profile domain-containing protein n=1 Tax=Wolbachia pipientis TaxID=955 RepID=A0A7G5C8X4_WOLPI|nr:Ulp1 family isopeptidase [Wolbachia pipientis]QMV45658.1 hypothetical protein HC358_00585 [Wolbachia pipientis]